VKNFVLFIYFLTFEKIITNSISLIVEGAKVTQPPGNPSQNKAKQESRSAKDAVNQTQQVFFFFFF